MEQRKRFERGQVTISVSPDLRAELNAYREDGESWNEFLWGMIQICKAYQQQKEGAGDGW